MKTDTQTRSRETEEDLEKRIGGRPLEAAREEELFHTIEQQMGESDRAQGALKELYVRHATYLEGRFSSSYGWQVEVDDLLQDTFIRAVEKAGDYKPAASDDREEQERKTRAWLGGIGRHLFLDRLEESKGLELDEDIEETARHLPPQLRDGEAISEKVELTMDVLDDMNWKERVVLRVTWSFYDPEKEHNRLPNAVSTHLADLVDVQPGSVRKIRQRALKKLEAGVKERLRQ